MNTVTNTLKHNLGRLMSVGYSETQLQILEIFFRFFSDTAIIYLTKILVNRLVRGLPFEKVFVALLEEYSHNWSRGTAGRIGDPDDVAVGPNGTYGIRNAEGFFNVYHKLKIKTPQGLY